MIRIFGQNNALLRSLSATLVLCLLAQVPAEAGMMAQPGASAVPAAEVTAAGRTFAVRVPAAAAVVEEIFEAASGPAGSGRVVYLLQDAHTNAEAQFNAARVIDAVMEQRPVKTIFLEGGTGDNSLNFLKPVSDPSRRREAAERFVRKGLLQAAEYVNLVSQNDLELWGVEDPGLYAKALEAYRVVAASREAALAHLDQIDVTIGSVKAKTFSPLLSELDSARRAAAREELPPMDYLTLLNRVALAAGIDPLEAPLLERVGRLIREERSDKAHADGSAPDELSAADLDIPAVIKAMSDLENRLYAQLAKPEVLEIVRAGFAAEALRDLVLMKMRPEFMPRSLDEQGRPWELLTLSAVINRQLIRLGLGGEKIVYLRPELDPVFRSAREFYALTIERDQKFMESLESRMSVTGEREAILIAGGYHAPNLKHLLRSRGISFVSLVPQTTHPTDAGRYERLLLAQATMPAPGASPAAMNLKTIVLDPPRFRLLAEEIGVGPVELPRIVAGARMSNAPGVVLTGIDDERELAALRQTASAIGVRGDAPPKHGPGGPVSVSVVSDEHGGIDRFDQLILDAIREAFPEARIPADFVLDGAQPLERQINRFKLDFEKLRERIFFHNIGDLMDRGDYGVQVFRRSRELVSAGLSSFVIGNHDLWEMMNLWGVHLPWYDGFHFYEYRDIVELVASKRRESADARDPRWWAERLAEYNAHHRRMQTQGSGDGTPSWNDLDALIGGERDPKGKHVPGTGLYGRVASEIALRQEHKHQMLWGRLMGYDFKLKLSVYTGTRSVGGMSLRWWEELLGEFKTAAGDYDPDLPAGKAWHEAIRLMEEQILPVLHRDLDVRQAREDGWTWKVFDAINHYNYTSPEWWAKDWVSHKGWGTSVLQEINDESNPAVTAGIRKSENPAAERKRLKSEGRYVEVVTEANYLANPTLNAIGEFYRQNFHLYQRDVYGNVMMHAFLPVDIGTPEEPGTGEFYFVYKGVEYRGKGDPETGAPSVWEGLDRLAATVRDPQNSPAELMPVLDLVNSWYADNTTQAKTPDVLIALNRFGAERLAEVNGFERLFTGHLPVPEFEKQPDEVLGAFKGFNFDNRIFFTDHSMSLNYGRLGGRVRTGEDGLRLRGFAAKNSDEVLTDPPTIRGAYKSAPDPNGTPLFMNRGVDGQPFWDEVRTWVSRRIDELEQGGTVAPSAARMADEVPRPAFINQIPDVPVVAGDEATFAAEFEWPDDTGPQGRFYLRTGMPGRRWDFIPAAIERVEGADRRWRATAVTKAYFEGTHEYQGTFAWFAPGIKPRKPNESKDPDAVWQSDLPFNNASAQIELSSRTAELQADENRRVVMELFDEGMDKPLLEAVPNKTIPALRATVRALVERLQEQELTPGQTRRLYQFVRNLLDLKGNYLDLPAEWFMDTAAADALEDYFVSIGEPEADVTPERFEKMIVESLRDGLRANVSTYLRAKIGVPHLRGPQVETQVSADGRLDFLLKGIAADLPMFENNIDRTVLNAAVGLKDHAQKVIPGFRVRVSTPPVSAEGSPQIVFRARYFDIRKPRKTDPSDPDKNPPYHTIRTFDHIYDARFSPFAAEDFQAKYAIGALNLVMEMLGQTSEEFLRQHRRDVVIEVDSFIPERTGLGGSVTLGALISTAIMEHLGLGRDISHEETALIGMLLEATLGDLGGWQDGYPGVGLRILNIAEGNPVTQLQNVIGDQGPFASMAQKDLLIQLEKHGVLFLSHPHRSGNTLKKLISGYLNRDPIFMKSMEEGTRDLEAFKAAFASAATHGTHVPIRSVARWINQARTQFESAAPGFVTPESQKIIDDLTARGWIIGAKPVGAGAGGFLFLILSDPAFRPDVEEYLRRWVEENVEPMRRAHQENFLDPGDFPFALDPGVVHGMRIERRDRVGARMSAWDSIDWSKMDAAKMIGFMEGLRDAALEALDREVPAGDPNDGKFLIQQQDVAIHMGHFLAASSGAVQWLRGQQQESGALDQVNAMRKQVIDRWKRHETSKAERLWVPSAQIKGGWPSGFPATWQAATRVLRALELLERHLNAYRSVVEPDGVFDRFESMIQTPVLTGLVRSLFSAPMKDEVARSFVATGIRDLEITKENIRIITSISQDELFKPGSTIDRVLAIRNAVAHLEGILSEYLEARRQEFGLLVSGPAVETQSQPSATGSLAGLFDRAPNVSVEDGETAFIRTAAEAGIDLPRLINTARFHLDRADRSGESATAGQILDVVRAVGDLESAILSLTSNRQDHERYALHTIEAQLVRRWIVSSIRDLRARKRDDAALQSLLAFWDRLQEAVKTVERPDRENRARPAPIKPFLSTQVWRPVIERLLADQAPSDMSPSDPASVRRIAERSDNASARLKEAVDELKRRAAVSSTDSFEYELGATLAASAAEALADYRALSAGPGAGARLAEKSTPRIREGRTYTARYLIGPAPDGSFGSAVASSQSSVRPVGSEAPGPKPSRFENGAAVSPALNTRQVLGLREWIRGNDGPATLRLMRAAASQKDLPHPFAIRVSEEAPFDGPAVFRARRTGEGIRVYAGLGTTRMRPVGTFAVRRGGTADGSQASGQTEVSIAGSLEPSLDVSRRVDAVVRTHRPANAAMMKPRVFYLDLDLFAAAAEEGDSEPFRALAALTAAELKVLQSERRAPVALVVLGDARLKRVFQAAAAEAGAEALVHTDAGTLGAEFAEAAHLDLVGDKARQRPGHRALSLQKLRRQGDQLSLPAIRAILRAADRAAVIDLANPSFDDKEAMIGIFEAMGVRGATWEQILRLLDGSADEALFAQLSFPAPGFVPLDRFVRAAMMAARMAARSA